jgi:Restriction endonuclease
MAQRYRYRVRSILRKVDAARTADAKGDALEELVTYLFEAIPGVECADRNILNVPRSHELDLAFWNDQRLSDLHFLDAILIVECKATKEPVRSADVAWFIRKLQDRGAHHGILVSLKGLTGRGRTSAHSEILKALMRDKIRILVLTRPEILGLTAAGDLAKALKRKLLQLTLREAVHMDN